MGLDEHIGSVETGKLADLVLTRVDPLADVHAPADPATRPGRVAVGPTREGPRSPGAGPCLSGGRPGRVRPTRNGVRCGVMFPGARSRSSTGPCGWLLMVGRPDDRRRVPLRSRV
jgi:hypothetical protein